MTYKNLLDKFITESKEILGDELVGIYLHGSAAMGCFNPAKSDIDLLIVVRAELTRETKSRFMRMVVRINEDAPAKGIEMSIVRRDVCRPFVYPTPVELHFSAAHFEWYNDAPDDYIEKMNGTDKDLAAHFVITRHCGRVLCGEAIDAVFGDVAREHYIDSIWLDIENAREDILSDPMYITLNLCRVLAYVRDGLVLSKKTGGEWGTANLPEQFVGIVRGALSCYETDAKMSPDSDTAARYAEYMLSEIEKAK